MSAKMATPRLLKTIIFWKKTYDVIILVNDVTNKIYDVIQIILQMCSCDQSLVTVAFLWEKLSQLQFYRDLTRETVFFEGWSLFKFNNLRLALGANLKFCTSVTKGLKIKVRKFWGLIHTFVEVTGEKLVVGPFCLPPFAHPE